MGHSRMWESMGILSELFVHSYSANSMGFYGFLWVPVDFCWIPTEILWEWDEIIIKIPKLKCASKILTNDTGDHCISIFYWI